MYFYGICWENFPALDARWHIVASSSDWFLVLFASVVTLSSAEVLDFRCAKWVRARKPKGYHLLSRLYSLFQRILSVRKSFWASTVVRAVVIGAINFLSFGFSTQLKIARIFLWLVWVKFCISFSFATSQSKTVLIGYLFFFLEVLCETLMSN